jgi:hypothetical protein
MRDLDADRHERFVLRFSCSAVEHKRVAADTATVPIWGIVEKRPTVIAHGEN